MTPKILLLTGPQASGNHLWSKIYAMHPEVQGWEGLKREYWINHQGEPFKNIWTNPDSIDSIPWNEFPYWAISISCPFVDRDGRDDRTMFPQYDVVLPRLEDKGDLQIGIIGRDQTIMGNAQVRKRGVKSFHNMLNKIDYLTMYDHIFLSSELLYLYRRDYLASINGQSIVPIDFDNSRLHYILNEDPNTKYVHYVEHSWLDKRHQNGRLKDNSIAHDIK